MYDSVPSNDTAFEVQNQRFDRKIRGCQGVLPVGAAHLAFLSFLKFVSSNSHYVAIDNKHKSGMHLDALDHHSQETHTHRPSTDLTLAATGATGWFGGGVVTLIPS